MYIRVIQKNNGDGAYEPWTDYEFGCSGPTLKHVLADTRHQNYDDSVVANVYNTVLNAKCIYADDGPSTAIYCFCDSQGWLTDCMIHSPTV